MTTIRDILNKLKWHPDYDFSQVEISYLSRPEGILTIWGNEVEDIGTMFVELRDGTMIPLHRLVRIAHDGKTIWDREQRGKI